MVDAPRSRETSIDNIPLVQDFRRQVERLRLADFQALQDEMDQQRHNSTERQEKLYRRLEPLPAAEELVLAVLWGEKQAGSAYLVRFETKASKAIKSEVVALRASVLRRRFVQVSGYQFSRPAYYRAIYWLRRKELLVVGHPAGKVRYVWIHHKAPRCYQDNSGPLTD